MEEQPAQPPVLGKGARYALFMLTIAYALNFIDRQILVILQESIKLEMGLSDTQLGLLSGLAFAVVYISAGLPIAYLADRINRRNIVAIAVAVWSGMTALSGLANSFSHLLLARLGVGIGEAGGSPPSHSMLSDYFPPNRRGTAMSTYALGVPIGMGVGLLGGGFLAEYFGWRAAFMVVGLPGVLFAVVFFFTVKEPLRGKWESVAEAEFKPTLGETLVLLRQSKTFIYVCLALAATAFVGYGTGNFGPSFLMRVHGLPAVQTGILLAIATGVGGGIGTLMGGLLADRLGERDMRWYLWVPAIGSLLGIPLAIPYFLIVETPLALFVLVFCFTVVGSTYLGPALALIQTLVPPATRAMTSAILFFVINLVGMGLGPLSAGALSDYFTGNYGVDGLRYALLTISSVGILAVFFFFKAAASLPAELAEKKAKMATVAGQATKY